MTKMNKNRGFLISFQFQHIWIHWKKISRIKINVNFQNLQKSSFVRSKFSKIRSSINLPGGTRGPTKFLAQSVQLVWCLLENNSTDKQSIYLYIELFLWLGFNLRFSQGVRMLPQLIRYSSNFKSLKEQTFEDTVGI